MSSTTCEVARPDSQGRDGTGGRALLPAVRRAMQLGYGPPALTGWLRARGVHLAPRAEWTPADEQNARALARQLDDVVGPYAVDGGRLAPLTYQPKHTVPAVVLRVE